VSATVATLTVFVVSPGAKVSVPWTGVKSAFSAAFGPRALAAVW